jgi:hypothetical protein
MGVDSKAVHLSEAVYLGLAPWWHHNCENRYTVCIFKEHGMRFQHILAGTVQMHQTYVYIHVER